MLEETFMLEVLSFYIVYVKMAVFIGKRKKDVQIKHLFKAYNRLAVKDSSKGFDKQKLLNRFLHLKLECLLQDFL